MNIETFLNELMNPLTDNNSCHVCFEINVNISPDFSCQTENCQFLLCKDCKQRYFVEQHQTTCPGCRLESIDLSILPRYRVVEKVPSRNQKSCEKLIKGFKITMYITAATVVAYWIGVIVLYSYYGTSNLVSIIILRLLLGYFILFVIGVFLFLLCLSH